MNEVDPNEYELFSVSASRWAQAMTINKTLIHLDFSFNNLKKADIIAIGEALK